MCCLMDTAIKSRYDRFMGNRFYHVYMLASRYNGTLYIGITSDLVRRIHEHRSHADPESFTARYDVTRLVWFEAYDDPDNAIRREKRLKEWKRAWRVALIEKKNPRWEDLYLSLL